MKLVADPSEPSGWRMAVAEKRMRRDYGGDIVDDLLARVARAEKLRERRIVRAQPGWAPKTRRSEPDDTVLIDGTRVDLDQAAEQIAVFFDIHEPANYSVRREAQEAHQ